MSLRIAFAGDIRLQGFWLDGSASMSRSVLLFERAGLRQAGIARVKLVFVAYIHESAFVFQISCRVLDASSTDTEAAGLLLMIEHVCVIPFVVGILWRPLLFRKKRFAVDVRPAFLGMQIVTSHRARSNTS